MSFSVSDLPSGAQKVILQGRLDAQSASAMELQFTAAVGAAGRNVMVDMTGVSFVASLGIRLFLSTARVLQRKGAKMVIFGVAPAVKEVFDTVALDTLIPMVGTEAEAAAALAG